MLNIKEDVAQALSSIGIAVYFFTPAKQAKFPCITYFEIDNRDGNLYADNNCLDTQIQVVVDIFANGSTTSLFTQVDAKMKELGFTREFARDLPAEEDTGIQHKTTRYKLTKSN